MIDYSLVSNNREELAINYPDLAEHVDSVIISKTEPTTRVETCLLILSGLNDPISKRKDLM